MYLRTYQLQQTDRRKFKNKVSTDIKVLIASKQNLVRSRKDRQWKLTITFASECCLWKLFQWLG